MKSSRKPSAPEETLWMWLKFTWHDYLWVREFKFHPRRKWRFDFANVQARLAIEVDGVVYGARKGGHQTPSGIERDREIKMLTQCFLAGGCFGSPQSRFPAVTLCSGFQSLLRRK